MMTTSTKYSETAGMVWPTKLTSSWGFLRMSSSCVMICTPPKPTVTYTLISWYQKYRVMMLVWISLSSLMPS